MNKLKSIERLKHQKKILEIFANGKSISEYPIQVIFIIKQKNLSTEIQAAFSAPKKHFKLAVDRNRIKRLMREAYRINKIQLITQAEKQNASIYMMFIYKNPSKLKFKEVEQKISLLLNRLNSNLINSKSNIPTD